jgi:hypothetical protein
VDNLLRYQAVFGCGALSDTLRAGDLGRCPMTVTRAVASCGTRGGVWRRVCRWGVTAAAEESLPDEGEDGLPPAGATA